MLTFDDIIRALLAAEAAGNAADVRKLASEARKMFKSKDERVKAISPIVNNNIDVSPTPVEIKNEVKNEITVPQGKAPDVKVNVAAAVINVSPTPVHISAPDVKVHVMENEGPAPWSEIICEPTYYPNGQIEEIRIRRA